MENKFDLDLLFERAAKRFAAAKNPNFVATQILIVRNVDGLTFSEKTPKKIKNLRGILQEKLASVPALKSWIRVPAEQLDERSRKRLRDLHFFDDLGEPDLLISPDLEQLIFANSRDNFSFVFCGNADSLDALESQYESLAGTVDEVEKIVDFARTERLGYLTSSPEMIGHAVSLQIVLRLPALMVGDQMNQVITACNAVGLRVGGYLVGDREPRGCFFTLESASMLGKLPHEIIELIFSWAQKICSRERAELEKLRGDEALFLRIHDCYLQARTLTAITQNQAMNLLALLALGVDLGYFPPILREDIQAFLPRIFKSSWPETIGDEDISRERATLLRELVESVKAPRKGNH